MVQVLGPQAVGVLLIGMGKDGAEGLKILKDKGLYTIAQDKVSSTVFGIPGEAIKLDAVFYILSPETIPQMIVNLVKKTNGGI